MNWVLIYGVALLTLGILYLLQGIVGVLQNREIYYIHEYILLLIIHKSKKFSGSRLPLNYKQRNSIGIISGLLLLYIGISLIFSPELPIRFLYFYDVDIKKFELFIFLFLFILVYPLIMFMSKLMKIWLISVIGGFSMTLFIYFSGLGSNYKTEVPYNLMMNFFINSFMIAMIAYFYHEIKKRRDLLKNRRK